MHNTGNRGRESRPRQGFLVVAGLVAALLLWSGCSAKTKHEWLTFFFDGVPEPGQQAGPSRRAPDRSGGPVTNAATRLAEQAAAAWVHEPFAKRECRSCHHARYSNQMIVPRNELCFVCHKDFIKPGKFVHGAVAGGGCLLCHAPHRSPVKYGVLYQGRELCFSCHQPHLICRPGQARPDACLECHEPHQSDRKFLLKQPKPDTIAAGP